MDLGRGGEGAEKTNGRDARLERNSRRPLPFDSALPNLRMNRAVARFTNSRPESTAKRRRDAGATKPTAARFDETEPAATKATATSQSKATSKTPASKEKAGGRYKFNGNCNGKCDCNGTGGTPALRSQRQEHGQECGALPRRPWLRVDSWAQRLSRVRVIRRRFSF